MVFASQTIQSCKRRKSYRGSLCTSTLMFIVKKWPSKDKIWPSTVTTLAIDGHLKYYRLSIDGHCLIIDGHKMCITVCMSNTVGLLYVRHILVCTYCTECCLYLSNTVTYYCMRHIQSSRTIPKWPRLNGGQQIHNRSHHFQCMFTQNHTVVPSQAFFRTNFHR